MYPYLVEWGWFKLGTYGLMMALGFLCAWFLLRSELRRRGLDTLLASRITFNGAIWGVIGARILSILEEPGRVMQSPLRTILLEGGLTWYGGLIAGVLATVYTIRTAKAPILPVFDAMSPAAFVGYAFGRMGCLLSGDGCYGAATTLPWGMSFPNHPSGPGFHCLEAGAIATWPPIDPATGRRYPADVLVHPTPIYEALLAFAFFAILWTFRKRLGRTGVMFGLFFAFGAVARFMIEFIRLNTRYFGLSLSQWIAVGMLGVGTALIVRAFLADRGAADAPADARGGTTASPTESARTRKRRR